MLLPEILEPHIYKCDSPIELADSLRKELIPYASDSLKQSQARKMEEYINILSDVQYKILVRTLASDLMELILRNFPDLQVDCEGRFKSITSFAEKIVYLQSQGRSVDTLKDIIGLRIITINASLKRLYEIAEVVFKFFELQKFMPCKLTTTESKKFVQEKYPDIEVPKRSYFSKQIVPFVKDYVFDPKHNGYQSLHFVFFDPRTERYIEIQIRTQKMDAHAEFGEEPKEENYCETEEYSDANHDKYKETRKKFVPHVDVDIQRIEMPGFIAVSETEFTDRCGLINAKSIILLN